MKILFTDATLLHGGAERVISILANKLVDEGYEVEILLYYNKPIWYSLDNRINVINDESLGGKGSPLKHILFRHFYFRKSDADVVISFLAPINMISILAIIATGKKIIVADRNDPRKIPVNLLERKLRDFLYRFADGIVLQSMNNMSYFSRTVQKKSTVILNPVDVGEYRGAALQCQKSDNIVAVGRIIKQKNLSMLINAFAKISDKFPTYKLIIYGEGSLRNSMIKMSEELSISDKVVFPGAIHDVFEKIKSAKLYAMTSNYEGMPNALIEAMCIGVPVISTKVSGAVDIIEDRINGRLVECNNVDELANTMKEMLNDYKSTQLLAQKSIELNDKLHSDQIIKNWLDFIDKVCE